MKKSAARKDAGSEQTGKSRKPHTRSDIHEPSRESGCAKWIQLRYPAPRSTNRHSLAAVAVRAQLTAQQMELHR